MSKISKKSFTCGHKGYGKYCHRCQQADKLEETLEKNKKYVTHKKVNKSTGKVQSKTWTKQEIKDEIERLRKEARYH